MEGDFYMWRDVSPRLCKFFLWQDQKTLEAVGQIFERVKRSVDYGLDEAQSDVNVVRNVLRRPGFSYEAAQSFFGDVIPECEKSKYLSSIQSVLKEAYFGSGSREHTKVPVFDLIDIEESEDAGTLV